MIRLFSSLIARRSMSRNPSPLSIIRICASDYHRSFATIFIQLDSLIEKHQLAALEVEESLTSLIPLVIRTSQTFTSNAVTLVAVEGTSSSISFSFNLVVTVETNEFIHSCMNRSGMRSNGVLFDVDLLT
jgi:hypothetical protein